MASTSADGEEDHEDDGEDDGEAEAAAERLMQSVEKAFAAAKAKGMPAATRLLKELRQVWCAFNINQPTRSRGKACVRRCVHMCARPLI